MAAMDRLRLQEERRKQGGLESKSHSDEMKTKTEVPKLLPFLKTAQVHLGMWFI